MTRVGVAVGKFYPFHRGHAYLISKALEQCDELFVFACTRNDHYLPGDTRADWIRQAFPLEEYPQLHVGVIDQDAENLPERGPKEWAEVTRRKIGGHNPDVVFTSEDYGHAWAKELECEHVVVDQARDAVPISGTQIREHPLTNLEYLHGPARAYYAVRIALTGDRDLVRETSKRLCQHYKTVHVPQIKDTEGDLSVLQLELEDWLAQWSGPLLITDCPVGDQDGRLRGTYDYNYTILVGESTKSKDKSVLHFDNPLSQGQWDNMIFMIDALLAENNGGEQPPVGVSI